MIHDVDWLQARHQWPGLNAVVVVDSQREINGKITNETRFYITSLVLLANLVGPMIRAHWAIENSLHWVMDMVFRDDECRGIKRGDHWLDWLAVGEGLTVGRLRAMRPKPHATWHLDEMFVSIGGKRMYLWRAVDGEGEVLDCLVQLRRNKPPCD